MPKDGLRMGMEGSQNGDKRTRLEKYGAIAAAAVSGGTGGGKGQESKTAEPKAPETENNAPLKGFDELANTHLAPPPKPSETMKWKGTPLPEDVKQVHRPRAISDEGVVQARVEHLNRKGKTPKEQLDAISLQVTESLNRLHTMREGLGLSKNDARKNSVLVGFAATEHTLEGINASILGMQQRELTDVDLQKIVQLRHRAASHMNRLRKARFVLAVQRKYEALANQAEENDVEFYNRSEQLEQQQAGQGEIDNSAYDEILAYYEDLGKKEDEPAMPGTEPVVVDPESDPTSEVSEDKLLNIPLPVVGNNISSNLFRETLEIEAQPILRAEGHQDLKDTINLKIFPLLERARTDGLTEEELALLKGYASEIAQQIDPNERFGPKHPFRASLEKPVEESVVLNGEILDPEDSRSDSPENAERGTEDAVVIEGVFAEVLAERAENHAERTENLSPQKKRVFGGLLQRLRNKHVKSFIAGILMAAIAAGIASQINKSSETPIDSPPVATYESVVDTVESGDWVTKMMIENYPDIFATVPEADRDDVTADMMKRFNAMYGSDAEQVLRDMGVGSGNANTIYPGENITLGPLVQHAVDATNAYKAAHAPDVAASAESPEASPVATPEASEVAPAKLTIEDDKSLTATLWDHFGSEYPEEAQAQYKQILYTMLKMIQADQTAKGESMSDFASRNGVESGDLSLVFGGDEFNTAEFKTYLDRAVAATLGS